MGVSESTLYKKGDFMNKLKMIVISIFCVGILGYGITNLIFIFNSDFVYTYASLFEKIRNIFFAVMMLGLFLLIIIRLVRGKIR